MLQSDLECFEASHAVMHLHQRSYSCMGALMCVDASLSFWVSDRVYTRSSEVIPPGRHAHTWGSVAWPIHVLVSRAHDCTRDARAYEAAAIPVVPLICPNGNQIVSLLVQANFGAKYRVSYRYSTDTGLPPADVTVERLITGLLKTKILQEISLGMQSVFDIRATGPSCTERLCAFTLRMCISCMYILELLKTCSHRRKAERSRFTYFLCGFLCILCKKQSQ